MLNEPERDVWSNTTPSDDVLLATLRYKYAWCMTVRYVVIILSLGGLLWLATPLAHEIAGKDTNFNVSITLALTATLAATTVAGYGQAARQRQRAKHLETRNSELYRRVEELRKELEGYEEGKGPSGQA
jgi:hypothetical protein